MRVPTFLRGLLGNRGGAMQRECHHVVSLCRALLGERGEASGAALARETLAVIGALSPEGRGHELHQLLRHEPTHLPAVLDHPERDAQGRVADQLVGRYAAPLEEPPRIDAVGHDALRRLARRGEAAARSSTS
ncbi:MAG TPA: hypothetical protein VF876_08245 [Burkholderiales bacterium]